MRPLCPQSNFLVPDSTPPRAILADFCFARVSVSSAGSSSEERGTPSFMAPELLLPTEFGLEKGVPSKEADVYALGMTIYQVLTGKRPFLQKRKARVIRAVILGERPAKPENAEEIGMTDAAWDLLEECWREDRTMRPDISEARKSLLNIIKERKTARHQTRRSLSETIFALEGSSLSGKDSFGWST